MRRRCDHLSLFQWVWTVCPTIRVPLSASEWSEVNMSCWYVTLRIITIRDFFVREWKIGYNQPLGYPQAFRDCIGFHRTSWEMKPSERGNCCDTDYVYTWKRKMRVWFASKRRRRRSEGHEVSNSRRRKDETATAAVAAAESSLHPVDGRNSCVTTQLDKEILHAFSHTNTQKSQFTRIRLLQFLVPFWQTKTILPSSSFHVLLMSLSCSSSFLIPYLPVTWNVMLAGKQTVWSSHKNSIQPMIVSYLVSTQVTAWLEPKYDFRPSETSQSPLEGGVNQLDSTRFCCFCWSSSSSSSSDRHHLLDQRFGHKKDLWWRNQEIFGKL